MLVIWLVVSLIILNICGVRLLCLWLQCILLLIVLLQLHIAYGFMLVIWLVVSLIILNSICYVYGYSAFYYYRNLLQLPYCIWLYVSLVLYTHCLSLSTVVLNSRDW